MKKVIAVLLSLLLLPALPPAGAATTPETALTAFLADPGVQVDGVLSEKNWFLKTDFSGGGPQGKLAVQWDGTALYVGAEFGDAEQLSLTVGTETVVCSLVDGSLTPGIPGAEAAIKGSVLELALPAAPLGLTVSGPGQEIVFAASLQKGETTSSIPENMLRLTDRIIRFSDNCDRFEGYSESSLKFGDYGSITIGPAGGTAGAYTFAGAVEGSIKGITRPFAFSGGAYDVEFTLDIRALPVISDPATAVWRGFVLERWGDTGTAFP